MSQIDTENHEKPNTSQFSKIFAFLLKFRQTSGIECLEGWTKEKVGCSVAFYGKTIAVFQPKNVSN